MPSKKPMGQGKTRTREHVIADLAVNHVERHILLCGFSVERVRHDYGIDLVMSTYNDLGEVESGQVYLQVKATDHLRVRRDGKAYSLTVRLDDLKLWLRMPDPVILIVYDARRDKAYWLYVQAYFESVRRVNPATAPASVTVQIPRLNRLRPDAVRRFARYRDHVLAQTEGKVHHHA